MIIEYYRPENKGEAVTLLSRKSPKTYPLGGGTILSQMRFGEEIAVVDLQSLGMRELEIIDHTLRIGANNTLQNLLESVLIPQALKDSIELECNFNLRQAATVGGAVASVSGKSPFNAMLLSLKAEVTWEPGGKALMLSEIHADTVMKSQGFISSISLPAVIRTAFQSISRTPKSEPLFCLCGTRDLKGITRITMTNPDADLPLLIFSGIIENQNETAISLSTQWKNDRDIYPDFKKSVLLELIDRIYAKLGQGE
jgi:xanthine dehydrogenase iron-sulfur cluster and FAD-binding subunit A